MTADLSHEKPPVRGRNQKAFAWGIGMTITGGLTSLVGLILMSIRLSLAEMFLGAHTLFGMPFAQEDAVKVVLVSLFALAMIGVGVIVFLAGGIIALVQFSRKS